MATIAKLKVILDILVEAGIGKESVAAEHDQIFLAPPDQFPEDSEVGQKLEAAGACYSDSDGWYIFV